MDYLVDTNVLIQWGSSLTTRYSVARAALKRLRRHNHRLCVASQNLIEFWNVATRPANKNGLGMNPLVAARVLRMLERFFVLLPDTPQIYQEWRRIVMEHQVLGVQVHDAHLVAVMRGHNVTHILTFNVKDFIRLAQESAHAGRHHAGIIVSDHLPFRELLRRILVLLQRQANTDLRNTLLWLHDFKDADVG